MIQLRQCGFTESGAFEQSNNLHTPPAPELIQNLLKFAPAPQSHDGLSAGAMRTWRAKASTCRCWLESPDYQCIILRDNLSNPSVSPRTTTSRKSESNAPRRCWLRRISRLSEIRSPCGFFDQSHLARHFRHMLGTTPRVSVVAALTNPINTGSVFRNLRNGMVAFECLAQRADLLQHRLGLHAVQAARVQNTTRNVHCPLAKLSPSLGQIDTDLPFIGRIEAPF